MSLAWGRAHRWHGGGEAAPDSPHKLLKSHYKTKGNLKPFERLYTRSELSLMLCFASRSKAEVRGHIKADTVKDVLYCTHCFRKVYSFKKYAHISLSKSNPRHPLLF